MICIIKLLYCGDALVLVFEDINSHLIKKISDLPMKQLCGLF